MDNVFKAVREEQFVAAQEQLLHGAAEAILESNPKVLQQLAAIIAKVKPRLRQAIANQASTSTTEELK